MEKGNDNKRFKSEGRLKVARHISKGINVYAKAFIVCTCTKKRTPSAMHVVLLLQRCFINSLCRSWALKINLTLKQSTVLSFSRVFSPIAFLSPFFLLLYFLHQNIVEHQFKLLVDGIESLQMWYFPMKIAVIYINLWHFEWFQQQMRIFT